MFSWLEEDGDAVRRVVAIFGMIGGGITGMLLLEDPSEIDLVLSADPNLTLDYGRSFVPWSPPGRCPWTPPVPRRALDSLLNFKFSHHIEYNCTTVYY